MMKVQNKSPRKIYVVCHCILNPASKVDAAYSKELADEEQLRQTFLNLVQEQEICLLQLPCPEFMMYGPLRWGHVKDQFSHSFFREQCRQMLAPILCQLKEYAAHPNRFELLGIVGINGSPSCGVTLTCKGEWGGKFGQQPTIPSVHMKSESGVFIEELQILLKEHQLAVPIVALDDALIKSLQIDKIYK